MSKPIIRPIVLQDNSHVAKVIREVLVEFGVTKEGSTYTDTELDMMFETYNQPRSTYYVVEEDNIILGGGGIAPLANYKGNACELQKMYFLKKTRGLGLGKALLMQCLDDARALEYDQCYLETMPFMKSARRLYEHMGFRYIDEPMGDTGHFFCQTHMLMNL